MSPIRRALQAIVIATLGCLRAQGQSAESEPAPAKGYFEAAPLPPPAEPFLVPDVPESLTSQASIHERWFSLKVGVVAIADYSAFHQDDASIAQVGKQKDQWEARAARLMMRGAIGKDYRVSYLVAAEYKGFESDPEDLWSLTDLSATFPIGGPATQLTFGKTKETFGYEMVGDAANLPHQERVLNPFFVSRNVGARLSHVIGEGQRATASLGVYNDAWVNGDALESSGTDGSARLTALAWDEADGTRFLHLGVAGRYVGADDNTLRYKGRPESNVADNYVDSGNLDGDHAWHLGLEALWNQGPISLLAEYQYAWPDASKVGDPEFSGYYLTASWVMTGETRRYDRTVGYARRVMPEGRWGAPELVLRFSHVDLADGAVDGGEFDKTYLGLNWWATRRWKLGVGWGRTWLDRSGLDGVTDTFHTRFQWVY